jgi:hypothetical protein
MKRIVQMLNVYPRDDLAHKPARANSRAGIHGMSQRASVQGHGGTMA